ncbi:MAG TPA: hypothetical protein VK081_00440 [Planctomycetota bacterium]|nr:hypothetical protein [Planctomycetota bacterium]
MTAPTVAPAGWRRIAADHAKALTLLATALVAAVVALPILVFPQLDPDDYRYLDLVRRLRAGSVDWLSASIVENRWDHLWWVDSEAVVRFFRPALMLSYLGDDLLHGGHARGLLLTNALLYIATCLVVAVLLRRLLPPFSAVLGSVLFAAFAAHAETIWYVAGRNETLAALGFLGGLCLHAAPGRARRLAPACYAFALTAKELTLPLPVLALAYDRFVAGRAPTLLGCLRAAPALWAGYAAIALLYLALRQGVIAAAGGSDLVYPYFVAPGRPDFALHVWHQLRSYGENLLLGAVTPPFLRADQVAAHTSALGGVLVCVLPVAVFALLRRDARAWWFAALAFCTWLPTSVVYVSERYAFLPSFAVAGIAGLCVARLAAVRAGALRLSAPAAAVVLLWTAHQASVLHRKNRVISQTPHGAVAVHEHLAGLRDRIPPDRPIYVLGLPLDVFGAQFLHHLARVALDDPRRECHVLTVLPDPHDWPQVQSTAVRKVAPDAIEVRGTPALMLHSRWQFPWTGLAAGTEIARARTGCRVRILEGEPTRCTAVRFTLPRPVDECVFLRFTLLASSVPMPHGALVRHGSLDIIKP